MASNDKQSKKEKESFSIRYKKWKLLAGYRWNVFKRRVNFAYILFGIAIFLFAIIMVPNAAHRLPVPSENWPYVFELQGSVSYLQNASNLESVQPAFNAKLEVGGYQAFTDSQGHFSLSFVSSSREDIPVLLSWNNNSEVERVSFDQGQFAKTVSFQLGA
jgi:hypothetical protein